MICVFLPMMRSDMTQCKINLLHTAWDVRFHNMHNTYDRCLKVFGGILNSSASKCTIFGVFMRNGHVKNRKLFLTAIKVHIYAYAHINIKYFDFLNDIWPLETGKVIKIQEN